MKRRLALIVPVVVALVAVGAAVLMRPAPAAHARGGGWMFAPSGTVELPAGLFCAFAIRSDTLDDKSYFQQTTQPDGTVVQTFTGTLKFRLTNESTGKYVDLNVSGPNQGYFYPDGTIYAVFHGPTVNGFVPPFQQEFGMPGIAYTTGLFTFTITPDGNISSVTSHGTVTDVCAELS